MGVDLDDLLEWEFDTRAAAILELDGMDATMLQVALRTGGPADLIEAVAADIVARAGVSQEVAEWAAQLGFIAGVLGDRLEWIERATQGFLAAESQGGADEGEGEDVG